MKQIPFLFLLLGIVFFSSCLSTKKGLFAQTDTIIAEQSILRLLDSVSVATDSLAQYTFLGSAKQICQEVFGTEHGLYADCLNAEGKVCYFDGKMANTDSLWQRVVEIRANYYGKEHSKYLDALTNMLIILPYSEKPKESELYIAKTRRALENDSLYYSISGADAIECIGNVYYLQAKLDSAGTMYRKVLSIRKKIYEENDPALGNSYVSIGTIELDKYNYEESALQLEKAEVLWRNAGNISLSNKRALYTNLGDLYKKMGKLGLAKQSLETALQFTKDGFSENHLYYGLSLINLGNVYLEADQFEETESLLNEALGVLKANSVISASALVKCYSSLIQLQISLNNQGEAEKLLEEVINYIDKEDPKFRRDYIIYLMMKGDFETKFNRPNAIPCFMEAIEFASKDSYENKSSLELTVHHNLATAYTEMGEYNKADSIYTALVVEWQAFSEGDSPDMWHANGALGMSKINVEQFDAAAVYFRKARNIADSMGYFRHFKHHEFMQAALRLEISWKKNVFLDTKAELFEAYRYQMKKGITHLSKKEQNDIIEGTLGVTSSLVHSDTQQEESSGEVNFNIALLDKGRVLQSEQQMIHFLEDTQNSLLFDHFNQLLGVRRRLSLEYLKPVGEQINLAQFETQEEELEAELSRASAAFRREQRINAIDYQAVYSHLPEDAAVIEFVHYDYYNPDLTDSVFYAAAVMRHGDASVRFIPLFEQEELVQLLEVEAVNDQAYLANVLYRGSDPIDQKNIPASEKLYELIWPGIEKSVAGVKNIYFSPSGLLHRINLGALVPKEGMHLRDVYDFHQMSSSRELVLQKEEPRTYQNHTAMIMGGIDYDEQQFTIVDSTASPDIGFQYTRNRSIGTAFTKLPATAKEAFLIKVELEQADYQVQHLSGREATETVVKEVGSNGKSPRILHIATHGFYFPDPDSTQTAGGFRLANHPMIRSGLALAGCNEAWLGSPTETGEDGILTAYEISQLNLSQTELVVLSACETGLGDIHGSEGVFGLQRAFKMAGAQYLLLSLWKVGDNATQELMTTFYKYYLQDQLSIPEAFNQAQRKLQETHPNNPAMWAGFVLVQ